MEALGHRNGWNLSLKYKTLLTLFLACGTSFLTLSSISNHNGMAQLAAAMMMLLSVLFLLTGSNKPWQCALTGVFWGLAIMSRMHLILAAPLFLYVILFGTGPKLDISNLKRDWVAKIIKLACLITPVLMVLVFFAWYNWARFGSIFDNGISYHFMDVRYMSDYHRYGYIHPHYFWYNVYYTIIRTPLFEHQSWFQEPSLKADWTEGYSLFFQSPALIYALGSLKMITKDTLVAALWVALVLVSIPILWLMGTGWMQFGARYLFDLIPFLFPLTIIGSRGQVTWPLVGLICASIAINIWGIHLFGVI
jgi:hypothetical protein